MTFVPDFAADLDSWSEFFTAVAGISATLIGLLFVALGLNPRIMADDGPTGLRVWSGETFHSFLVLLIISIAWLVPSSTGETLAITLGIIGAQGIIRVVGDALRVRRDPDPNWSSRHALFRFFSPGLAYLFILWAATGIWRHDSGALDWFVAIVFLLLISAMVSCWELLKAVGERLGRDPEAPR